MIDKYKVLQAIHKCSYYDSFNREVVDVRTLISAILEIEVSDTKQSSIEMISQEAVDTFKEKVRDTITSTFKPVKGFEWLGPAVYELMNKVKL